MKIYVVIKQDNYGDDPLVEVLAAYEYKIDALRHKDISDRYFENKSLIKIIVRQTELVE